MALAVAPTSWPVSCGTQPLLGDANECGQEDAVAVQHDCSLTVIGRVGQHFHSSSIARVQHRRQLRKSPSHIARVSVPAVIAVQHQQEGAAHDGYASTKPRQAPVAKATQGGNDSFPLGTLEALMLGVKTP